jgi:hypothetical protein
MSDYSLMELLKNDFCFESLKGAKEETKKSKETLSQAAEEYNKSYEKEIRQGTIKRQLMLEAAGLGNATEEEQETFFKDNNVFMPTVQTPILNFLYFLTRDYKEVETTFDQLREEYEAKYGDSVLGEGNLKHASVDTSVLRNDWGDKLEKIAEGVDESNLDDYEADESVTSMEDYIYGNMDSRTFQKLKKLKAKSKSDNENEAFQAYRMCMKICKENGLDFDKIPDLY